MVHKSITGSRDAKEWPWVAWWQMTRGWKVPDIWRCFFFFSSKLGQGVGLHGMSCECPVITGIWRCLWAMPLLESWLARVVWHWRTPFSALPCFCFKVDLNNRSTTPSLYASARKMGTRMVHWSEVICWHLTGDKILQGFIVKNDASFRAVFAGENAGAWRSYGMPSEAVSGAPFLPWQQLRSIRMNSGVTLVNWNSFITKVVLQWWSFQIGEILLTNKKWVTWENISVSQGCNQKSATAFTEQSAPYHQGGHRVVCVAGKEVGPWSLESCPETTRKPPKNWCQLKFFGKRPCLGMLPRSCFFSPTIFFRDCSWRDSAFGEKTLAEKMLRIQIGQEAVDSVLATATGRGNCRVCVRKTVPISTDWS